MNTSCRQSSCTCSSVPLSFLADSGMESSFKRRLAMKNTPKIALFLTLALILFTIISVLYPVLSPLFVFQTSSSPPLLGAGGPEATAYIVEKDCDIFTGEWVPNPEAPYYTNTTCWAIHDHQNCMRYGRPDADFMKWKWKPYDCELAIFNPSHFLELLRGKKLAFVGDSVARNHMQSLICLLSRVKYPEDVSSTSDEHIKRWLYRDYNLTIASFWSPFLVQAREADPDGPTHTGLFALYLDEPDEEWATQIHEFDYLVLSAGHWFFRPSVFYENGQLTGCHFCRLPHVPDLTKYYAYRKAFRAAFRAINGPSGFKGVAFLRTFAPMHFENGTWNGGGNCLRRRPWRNEEARLEGFNLELYMIQVEEWREAEREGRRRGREWRLMDTTQAMLLRPDGHPSRYGHWAHENVTLYNDCVHWCLPGPIDAWSDFLLHMLTMERRRKLSS